MNWNRDDWVDALNWAHKFMPEEDAAATAAVVLRLWRQRRAVTPDEVRAATMVRRGE